MELGLFLVPWWDYSSLVLHNKIVVFWVIMCKITQFICNFLQFVDPSGLSKHAAYIAQGEVIIGMCQL